MIDHDTYRRRLLEDPRAEDAELASHRESCAECREFGQSLSGFESRLERALRIKVPETSGGTVLSFPDRKRGAPRFLALAAGVAAAVVVAGALWLFNPSTTLAADLVKHMNGELPAWDTTQAVPTQEVDEAFKGYKVRLKDTAGAVSYATDCEFRGYVVPHLVVQSSSGPVTVMVLEHEHVKRPMAFEQGGYKGTIVPM
jgi:hypothetical protein